jgi:hypothetical protein
MNYLRNDWRGFFCKLWVFYILFFWSFSASQSSRNSSRTVTKTVHGSSTWTKGVKIGSQLYFEPNNYFNDRWLFNWKRVFHFLAFSFLLLYRFSEGNTFLNPNISNLFLKFKKEFLILCLSNKKLFSYFE